MRSMTNRCRDYAQSDVFTRQGLRQLAHDGVDLTQVLVKPVNGPMTFGHELLGTN